MATHAEVYEPTSTFFEPRGDVFNGLRELLTEALDAEDVIRVSKILLTEPRAARCREADLRRALYATNADLPKMLIMLGADIRPIYRLGGADEEQLNKILAEDLSPIFNALNDGRAPYCVSELPKTVQTEIYRHWPAELIGRPKLATIDVVEIVSDVYGRLRIRANGEVVGPPLQAVFKIDGSQVHCQTPSRSGVYDTRARKFIVSSTSSASRMKTTAQAAL